MSRTGECWDNAPIESFWATLKRECATTLFETRSQAQAAIFEYVMVFYNRTRRHSRLGYLSPAAFEAQFLETTFVFIKTVLPHFPHLQHGIIDSAKDLNDNVFRRHDDSPLQS